MRSGTDRHNRAFTLIELLIVIAVIAVLLGILLPALSMAMSSARAFRCQMSLRSVAFDFTVFADDELHGDRGNDDRDRPGRFQLETFQESQYGIDEFWAWEGQNKVTLPDATGHDPLRCSVVRGDITLMRDTPCSAGAISPPQNVSYGFNARLQWIEVTKPNGSVASTRTWLDSRILEHEKIPLAWDVDGEVAFQKGEQPVFSAPSLDSKGPYADDRLWFPATRHAGTMNVAFTAGHVQSTRAPLEESGWLWGFQP